MSPPILRPNYEHILFCTYNPVKQITVYLHFDHFIQADLLLHQEAYKVDSLQENGAHKQFTIFTHVPLNPKILTANPPLISDLSNPTNTLRLSDQ